MKIENKILILSLIFSVILYTVFRLLFKPAFGYGFLAGFAAAFINFRMLARGVRGLEETGSGGGKLLFSQIRLIITAVFLWYVLTKLKMNIIGILVGLSILPVCVPIVAIYNNVKGKNDGTPA